MKSVSSLSTLSIVNVLACRWWPRHRTLLFEAPDEANEREEETGKTDGLEMDVQGHNDFSSSRRSSDASGKAAHMPVGYSNEISYIIHM